METDSKELALFGKQQLKKAHSRKNYVASAGQSPSKFKPIEAINEVEEEEKQLSRIKSTSKPRLPLSDHKSAETSIEDFSPSRSSPSFRRAKRSKSKKKSSKQLYEFPVLVKGLETSFQIQSKKLSKSKSHNFESRPESSESNYDDYLLAESGSDGELTSYFSPSNWDSFASPGVNKSFESKEETQQLYNCPNLRSLLMRKNMQLESFLYFAVEDQGKQIPQEGIWKKKGFKDKKKQLEMFSMALNELIKIEKTFQELTVQNKELTDNHNHLVKLKKKNLNQYKQLKVQSRDILSRTSEEKTQNSLKQEELDEAIDQTKEEAQELSKQLLYTKEKTQKVLENKRQTEETYRMQIEDYRVSLLENMEERIKAQTKTSNCRKHLQLVENEKKKQTYLQKKTSAALNMLVKVMDYFKYSNEHLKFYEAYCKAVKQIKESTQETALEVDQVRVKATQDPRELIPYTRASDT